MRDFSDRLNQLLDYLGITPYKMAKEIGTSEAVISNVRAKRNKPSYDLLSKILNNYKVLNAEWLLTGAGNMLKSEDQELLDKIKRGYTPIGNIVVATSEEMRETYTPQSKTGKLHPKSEKKLNPTLHPTDKLCALCIEKERIIEQQQVAVDALREANTQLRLRLEEIGGKKERQVG